MPLRVGTVSYLNSVPLNAGLASHPDVALYEDVPSVLADQLAAGELDVGLIPVAELLRRADYRVVPNVAIGCVGAVLSVKLFADVPIEQIRTVRLDPSSRTSNALARVLLEGVYSLNPVYTAADAVDATLVIGDPVLSRVTPSPVELDLGEAWFNATGLPFVFAVWAGRDDVMNPAVVDIFLEAKQRGLKNLDGVIQREAAARGLSEELCRRYLREHIHFDFGEAEIAGLKWFATLAEERGVIDHVACDIDQAVIAVGGSVGSAK